MPGGSGSELSSYVNCRCAINTPYRELICVWMSVGIRENRADPLYRSSMRLIDCDPCPLARLHVLPSRLPIRNLSISLKQSPP